VALSSVWATTLATQRMAEDTHWIIMVITAIVVGGGAGLVNGIVIAYGRIVAFIATLAMLTAARGLAEILANRRTQIVQDRDFLSFFSGVCCGIAAVMMMARTTTGSSTHGTLYELLAIAAVVVGGTLLIGGRGTIVGTVLGVLIFTTLGNVFTLNNLSSSAQAVVQGLIIVAAVLLQTRLAAREGRSRGPRSLGGGAEVTGAPSGS